MKIVAFRRRLFAGGLALALVPVLLSAAPPEAAKVKAPPDALSPAEKVRNSLDQTLTLPEKSNLATLKDALDALHESAKLKFEIDEKAFASEGVANVLSTDYSKYDFDLKNVRVKDFLRILLKQIVISPSEATYVVVGEKVVITTDTHEPYRWVKQRVNVDCDKEELSSALKKLARETGTNLVIDARAKEEAKTIVTMQLQDVTLETAAVLFAESAGLKPVRVGNAVFLTTKEHAKAMFLPEIVIDPSTGLPAVGASLPALAGPIPLPDEWGPAGPAPILK